MALIDEIREAGGRLAAAINAKNAVAAAACYTPDAALLPPGAPIQIGTTAIQAYWQAGIDGGLSDVVLEPTEVLDFGDQCTELGVVTATGGTSGKYVVAWSKVDGVWKLHWDAFNFDA
ncbi:MAG: DUF4440 domain-containing protein [Pseudomonadota bacterium]